MAGVWYADKFRHIAGRKVKPEDVPAIWDAQRQAYDRERAGLARLVGGAEPVAVALSDFYSLLDRCVETGRPKRLALATRRDYELTLNGFIVVAVNEHRIGTLALADLGPAHFTAYARSLGRLSVTTVARRVAYVRAFLNYCVREGKLDKLPRYGNEFVKPDAQAKRDLRLGQKKHLTPEMVRRLYFHAGLEEKVWLALGLCGALDNADVSELRYEHLDRYAGTIDYRRRKVGKVRRVIPLPVEVWALLDLYATVRPDPASPADADRVFLTPGGLPLARESRSKTGLPHRIDYVAGSWSELMQRAGMRRQKTIVRVCVKCGAERPSGVKGCTCGHTAWRRREISRNDGGTDRRGFRSLRTTFANAPGVAYTAEGDIVMGHQTKSVMVESYLETVGLGRLQALTDQVWKWGMGITSQAPDAHAGAALRPLAMVAENA